MNTLQTLPGIRSAFALINMFAIVVVILITLHGLRRAAQARSVLGIATLPRDTLLPFVLWLGIVTVSFSTLRPYWGYEDLKIETRGSEIVLLVDVSRSMYAEDVSPSRIELAKRKLKDIIDLFARNGEAHRYGITVFAGDAYTVCPITADQGVLKQFIDIISPELVTGLGSNLGAGITLAVSRFDSATPGAHRVILLTDGEHSDADMSNALAELRSRGVRLDILGFGTPAGTTITLPNGALVTDPSRRPVISKLDDAALKELATETGGVYQTAVVDDSDVEALTASAVTGTQNTRKGQSTIRSYREFGSWLSLAALVILTVPLIARRRTALLLIPVMMTTVSTPARATPQQQSSAAAATDSAFTLYEQGEYSRAIEAFQRDLQRSPKDRALQFGLASSFYKAGRFGESQRLFQELSQAATEGRAYFESTYNEGNALLGLGRFQDAIDAYQKALDVKPGDQAAQHNLSVARAKLEEERAHPKTPTPTSTPTATATATSNSQSSPQAAPTPTPQSQGSPAPTPTQPGTPSPQMSPGETSPESPPPQETGSGQTSTPEPAPSRTATGDDKSTPMPNQTPEITHIPQQHEVASPTPAERLKEEIETPSANENPAAAGTELPKDDKTSSEAKAWLESLPDSPLLVRRHRGSPSRSEQTW